MKNKLDLNGKTILITGVAGFIGSFLTERLLNEFVDTKIVGIDNLNNYYDTTLKQYRLNRINSVASQTVKLTNSQWIFEKIDIAQKRELKRIFDEHNPSIVVNLASQAGVRNSITNPDSYVHSNIAGFFNVLECCVYRNTAEIGSNIEHLIYASSSSVYGGRKDIPFKESDDVSYPVSFYAATKKANELFAYNYSKIYNLPSTGLRFFTVYGPAGRPDMAYYSFAEKLRKGEIIQVYNFGKCERDFTYIDDIVTGLVNVMSAAPIEQKGKDDLPIPPYEIYNIGNSHPVNLMEFIDILAEELMKAGVLDKGFQVKDHLNMVEMQPGDVEVTYADISKLEKDYDFKPDTDLRIGLRHFAEWYKDYLFYS